MDLVASRLIVAESCDRKLKKKTFKNEIKLLIQEKTNQLLYTQTWKQPQMREKKNPPLNAVEIKRKFGTAPFASRRTVSFALLLVREALTVPQVATVVPQTKENIILIACNFFFSCLAWWRKLERSKNLLAVLVYLSITSITSSKYRPNYT